MPDTMKNMELTQVDLLSPGQLMEDDLIGIGDDVVRVIEIDSDSTGDNYFIKYEDDYGDVEVITFNYNDMIPLFVFIQEEE
jgi:hypothetical protein